MSNTIDTSKLESTYLTFADFTIQQMKKATKHALAEAGSMLANEAKTELKMEVPNATRPNPKYSDTLVDGVRWSVAKNGSFTKVHIMGTREKTSGTFRLRFFEKGTKTGNIKPHNFFSKAIAKVNPKVSSTFDDVLAKHIEKINSKNT